MDAIIVSLLRSPGGARWWQTARHIYAPEFVRHVEALLEGSTGSPLTDTLPWFGPDPRR